MNAAAFIKAMFDNPGDDTARLVFADWLADRGDPAEAAVRSPDMPNAIRWAKAHGWRVADSANAGFVISREGGLLAWQGGFQKLLEKFPAGWETTAFDDGEFTVARSATNTSPIDMAGVHRIVGTENADPVFGYAPGRLACLSCDTRHDAGAIPTLVVGYIVIGPGEMPLRQGLRRTARALIGAAGDPYPVAPHRPIFYPG